MPERSRVAIRFDDVGDPKLFGRVVTGTVVRIANKPPHGTQAEVKLDSPLDYASDVTFRGITTLLVAPRYRGQSLARLMLAGLIVNVTAARIEDTDGKKQLHSIAIATMTMTRATNAV